MDKRELLYNGNEKQVYATDNPDRVIFHYKDVTLAYKGIKRAVFKGKGILNNSISALLLDHLNSCGVSTHYIEKTGEREQLCRKIEIIPLEVVVRNRIAGSLAERIGVEEGLKPARPVLDLHYNNDSLGSPLINDHHALALGLVTPEELGHMYSMAVRTNTILEKLFIKAGIELIDVKLEFGRASDNGEIIISDEISPDTARLWDASTGRKLDKDRFRRDLSDVVASYREVLERLTAAMEK